VTRCQGRKCRLLMAPQYTCEADYTIQKKKLRKNEISVQLGMQMECKTEWGS
jgi:hypothetical protein